MRKFLLITSIIFLTSAVHAQITSKAIPGSNLTQTSIMKFYPNPATTVISFDFQKAYERGYSLQIFNAVLGRKMWEQTNLPEKISIDLGNFTRGVYVYQLRDKTGRLVETGKFQVSK